MNTPTYRNALRKNPLCSVIECLSSPADRSWRNLLLPGFVAGAMTAGANAYGASLAFTNDNLTIEEPDSGSRSASLILTASFDDNLPGWNNLTSCTISGTVQVRTLGGVVNAVEGEDYNLIKSSFSMTTEPRAVGEQVEIDPVSDEIIFEVLDDDNEDEATEYIEVYISSYGVTCGDSNRNISISSRYGTAVLEDPFNDQTPTEPEQPGASPKAIPVHQKSLTAQLNALRSLTLHSAKTRDRSIAKEIDRARQQGGSSVENLGVRVRGQAVPTGDWLGGSAGEGLDNFGRWGFFLTGSVDVGELDDDDNTAADFDSHLLIAGLDYYVTDNILLGGAISRTESSSGDQALAETDFSRTSLALFGSLYARDSYYLDALVTYGSAGYDLERQIDNDSDGRDAAAADTDGHEMSVSLGAGYNLQLRNINLRVFSFINYVDAQVDGYQETASGGSSAAQVDGVDLESLTADWGVALSGNINTSFAVLTPSLSLSHERQFADTAIDVNGQFVGGPDAGAFAYLGSGTDRDYYNAEAGLSGVFRNGLSAYMTYSTYVDRRDLASDQVNLGVRWQF